VSKRGATTTSRRPAGARGQTSCEPRAEAWSIMLVSAAPLGVAAAVCVCVCVYVCVCVRGGRTETAEGEGVPLARWRGGGVHAWRSACLSPAWSSALRTIPTILQGVVLPDRPGGGDGQ